MYILNTTYLVDSASHSIWAQWVKSSFIIAIQTASQRVGAITFCKVMISEQQDGETYSLQIQFPDQEAVDAFSSDCFPDLSAYMDAKFRGKYLLFQTLMQEV